MKLNIQRWFTIDSNGNEYIYLYYYPTYREMAFMNEVTQWPCKIGRTDQHPVTRVSQQLNSCAPETPVIALVFQCDDSRSLESTIHNYMKLHKRFIEHSFNKEWFNTNPDEVVGIIKALMQTPDDVYAASLFDNYGD